MKVFASINILYLFTLPLIGIYGDFYAPFSPNEITKATAKYASIIFILYFVPIGMLFFIRNRSKIALKNRWAESAIKFYLYVVLMYPMLIVVLAYAHYAAISKGLPSIHAAFFGQRQIIEVTVTGKRLWGKRDRQEEVSISGFSDGFPVSKYYYDSVVPGQKVNVVIGKTAFGTKIGFLTP